MAGTSPASGVRAGAVFCSAATWWVLAARKGAALVFCPILPQSENHHRADIPVPWAEALRSGCPDGARIRCRPVLRPSTQGLIRRGQFSAALTERLLTTLCAELRHRQQEDAPAPRFSTRHRDKNGRFHTSPSCTGALHLPPYRPEPRSPRVLHFF
ncbi:hypothetical protein Amal_04092 [Acetobacter malorum]|uniref:Uncharacterized protein n=1 Tax=Acetobacter malorum TaxID=178901 RepID=A0A177FTY1_9PROT|nr:hypothetical protein [Acetobacter malorum]OAG71548.1 hypothetical protein Amal_04092 [Acetobacter malorum]